MIRARMRRVAVLLASASLVAATVGVGVDVASAPSARAVQKVRVVEAIRQLPAKAETPAAWRQLGRLASADGRLHLPDLRADQGQRGLVDLPTTGLAPVHLGHPGSVLRHGRLYPRTYVHEAREAALDGAQKMARSFEAVFSGDLLFGEYEEA